MSRGERILAIVESIPAGRVTTYGSIADVVEGASARSVGHTLRTDGHGVPWWRVVTANGRPAPGAEEAAYERFLEERTPLRAAGDGTWSVDVAAAIWHVPEASPDRPAGVSRARLGGLRVPEQPGQSAGVQEHDGPRRE